VNRDAERAGIPQRVFCASMADVFEDHPQVVEPRQRLWQLIEATPWLRWQLLTKRPENVTRMIPWTGAWPRHVWLGTSVERQREADWRIPLLLAVPGVHVRFVSCEPLLGPLDLTPWLPPIQVVCTWRSGPLTGGDRRALAEFGYLLRRAGGQPTVDWVIAGGESGPGARPMDLGWLRSLRDRCAAAGVAWFCKQLGSCWSAATGPGPAHAADPKGGDWARWPADLRVRQYPPEAVTEGARR
jgi:protein gp37